MAGGLRCSILSCVRFTLAAAAMVVLAPLMASAQPTLTIACDSDSDCGGVDEACVLGRCLSIRCNSDSECTNRLPFCLDGICQDPSCTNDDDCRFGGCVNGHCRDVDCTGDTDCPAGRSCVDHECRDCVSNPQCGAHGVCSDNNCVCVECTQPGQCGFDQTCSREHTCVPLCEADRVFVSASDGNRICKACVNPNAAQRCNEFPGCRANTICAQGFCINRCSLDPPDFDRLLDELTDLRYRLDPDGLPDCPRCNAIFELAGVRTVLERGGVDQPVRVRLLTGSGKLFAELGSGKPNRGSWASLPLQAQPALEGELGKEGGCGYMLEIRSTAPAGGIASGPICLTAL